MSNRDSERAESSAEVNQSVKKPKRRKCPACGSYQFKVIQFPADTASVACAMCENRCLLADLRESSVDSRWFDE